MFYKTFNIVFLSSLVLLFLASGIQSNEKESKFIFGNKNNNNNNNTNKNYNRNFPSSRVRPFRTTWNISAWTTWITSWRSRFPTSWNTNGVRTRAIFNQNYFLGNWIGIGYSCQNYNPIPEDIVITYENSQFLATKINGDNCVPSGYITFRGPIPTEVFYGVQYPCTITLGSPGSPASSTNNNCKIRPVDKDTFEVNNWNLKFVRGSLDDNLNTVLAPAVEPTGTDVINRRIITITKNIVDKDGNVLSTTHETVPEIVHEKEAPYANGFNSQVQETTLD
jgi:hypothetical protein